MTTVCVNPTYDPLWRILATEVFYHSTGISLGYGHRAFYDDEEAIFPFRDHPTPEHGVQLVLARWLKHFVANNVKWSAPTSTIRLSSRMAWKNLIDAVENNEQLPSIDFTPLSLVRFLARWYGHVIASRVKSRDVRPNETQKSHLAKILNHLLTLSLSGAATRPTDAALRRVTNLDVTVLPTKRRKNKKEVVNAPRKPSSENESLWRVMPPALDDFEFEDKIVSKSLKIEFLVPVTLSKVYVDPRGISLRPDLSRPVSKYPIWYDRPFAKTVLGNLFQMIKAWYNSENESQYFYISQIVRNIIPFVGQEYVDTMILKSISKSDDVETVATGMSDATVRFSQSDTVRPSFYPKMFRIVGIQRKTIAFVPTIYPNFGRAYHIQSNPYETLSQGWQAVKRAADTVSDVLTLVDVRKPTDSRANPSFQLCFRPDPVASWTVSHMIQRKRHDSQTIETRAKLKSVDAMPLNAFVKPSQSITDRLYGTIQISPKIQRCLMVSQQGLKIASTLHDMCISDHIYYRWSTKVAKYVLNSISRVDGYSEDDILVIVPWEKDATTAIEELLSFLETPQPTTFTGIRESVKAFEKKGVEYPALKIFEYGENEHLIRDSICLGAALSPWHISLMDQFAPLDTIETLKSEVESPLTQKYASLASWLRMKAKRLSA